MSEILMTSTALPDPGSGRWWPAPEKPFRQPRWRDIPDPPRPKTAKTPTDGIVIVTGPMGGKLRIDVAGSAEGHDAALRSWHEDGMRLDDPTHLGPDRVRWIVPVDGLVFVSVDIPGEKAARWYRWADSTLAPSSEEEAFAWTPGRPGLPPLTGSAEQIRWATRLRSDYLSRFPAKSVPRNVSADRWIRNRHALGVP
jgi:hypothetical protein